ncbi:MAG: Transcriptional regulator FurA [Actinomycetota bacterium]|jgi:Fur family ferric uptake transcriptional regulator
MNILQKNMYSEGVHLDVSTILRAHGLNVTAQRMAVLRAVSAMPHSTADAIAEEAKIDIGTISRQSVYDALSVFTEHGVVRRIQPIGSPALYESRVGDNHHHVICRGCGLVADVDCAVGHRPCLTASETHGFVIDEAEVAYWGYCPTCATSLGSDSSLSHTSIQKEGQPQ